VTSCHLPEPQSVLPMHGICALLVIITFASTGCSVKKFAISKLANSLASESTRSFATDDDPELIGDALPFALKLMEGLLDQGPQHRGLWFATSSGFTQYSYVCVQQPADEVEQKDVAQAKLMRLRARNLYLRARDYGIRGLEVKHPGFGTQLRMELILFVWELFSSPIWNLDTSRHRLD
jgi:hypothetical protein